jgi:cytochrome P450
VTSSVDTGVWRRARKAFQLFLTADAVNNHLPTQEAEAIQLLVDLLTTPEVCENFVVVVNIVTLILAGYIRPHYAHDIVPDLLARIWKALSNL